MSSSHDFSKHNYKRNKKVKENKNVPESKRKGSRELLKAKRGYLYKKKAS